MEPTSGFTPVRSSTSLSTATTRSSGYASLNPPFLALRSMRRGRRRWEGGRAEQVGWGLVREKAAGHPPQSRRTNPCRFLWPSCSHACPGSPAVGGAHGAHYHHVAGAVVAVAVALPAGGWGGLHSKGRAGGRRLGAIN